MRYAMWGTVEDTETWHGEAELHRRRTNIASSGKVDVVDER